ncbi:unnamed protein product [Thelazia callipaeda]|uniref:Checkpoint protein n=1 Tax=Thelazia callipaeda TaxID=103827 RepID=A0A0N5D1B8_THECL|nr:unnamed protein product [Thelazia callipaeda]
MSGVSEEQNEIYMEIDKDYLFRSVYAKDRSTKIRLVRLGIIPHLKVEQKSCDMVHDIPVFLIPTKYWKTYDIPALNNVQVALYLPSLSTVRNLVNSFKNMGVKYMTIKGNQEGELQFCGDLDSTNIAVYFSNLQNVCLQDGDDCDRNELRVLRRVRVDIKAVHTFLRSLSTGFTVLRILLRIVPEKMAIFSVEQNEASVIYIVSGMA